MGFLNDGKVEPQGGNRTRRRLKENGGRQRLLRSKKILVDSKRRRYEKGGSCRGKTEKKVFRLFKPQPKQKTGTGGSGEKKGENVNLTQGRQTAMGRNITSQSQQRPQKKSETRSEKNHKKETLLPASSR